MLQLTTKWMTNTLAKKSIYNNDYIQCVDNKRLYIIGVGKFTSSCKMTFNYEVRDESDNVIYNGNDAYLDALTKIILGTSPKAKANKDTNESKDTNEVKPKKQASKQASKECLYLTFDEAFEMACKQIESYKGIAIELDKYDNNDTIKLTLIILKDAQIKEHERRKEEKKQEELKALRVSLNIAIQQGNNMLVEAIQEMILNKEIE